MEKHHQENGYAHDFVAVQADIGCVYGFLWHSVKLLMAVLATPWR